ncbi:translocation/assembly module TamB domain-containing protein [Desulfurobacterium atlanticum]|uniref:translocation/assembly module TamB domain-containing protein n=1 Tax=Desulfurobacterium atlanticum TaxID=240169 RepID=UPI001C604D72|nr:translocation/assembly module TamB domain-containing protein [Desulfurobacterium atlanticum]
MTIFIFFFYKFSVEVFHYSLQKLEGKGINFENLKVVPGKFIKVEFSGVKYKRGGVLFYGRDGKVVFDILSSIREFKPVFSDVELKSFRLIIEGEKERESDSFKIPDFESISLPFKVDRIGIGDGEIKFMGTNVCFNGLLYENRKFIVKPLELDIKGRIFSFSQITGKIKNEKIFINRFSVSSNFGKVDVRAGGDIYLKVFNATISGKFNRYRFNVLLSKDSTNLYSKGFFEIPQFLDKIFFDVKLQVLEDVFVSGTLYPYGKSLETEFSGKVSKSKVNIRGFLNGDLQIGEFKVKNLVGEYSLVGDLTSPVFIFKGGSDLLSFNNGKLSNLKVSLNLRQFDRIEGNFSFKRGGLFDVSLQGSVRKRKFLFSGDIRNFNLKDNFLKKLLSQDTLNWIPDVKGKVVFNGEFNENRLKKFQATLIADEFYFRGFSGQGELRTVLFGKDKLSLYGKIKSSEGEIVLNGTASIDSKTLNLKVDVKDFSVSSLDFLSKEGLAGIVSGKGSVEGKFSELSGTFQFYSPEFSYFGEKFSAVKGELIFSYPSLFLMAKSDDERLTISKLTIDFFPRFSIEVLGKVRNFHLATLEKIFSRYKIDSPLTLKGVATGDFNVSFRTEKKNPFRMEIGISRFDGSYELPSIVSGSAIGRGKVVFDKYLTVEIKGVSKNTSLATIPFEGGEFQLSFENAQLKISGKKFSLSLVDKSKIGFDAVVDIQEKKIDTDFNMEGEKKISSFRAIFSLAGKVLGTFDSFEIPVTGKVNIESDYFLNNHKFSFSGKLLEPQNKGKFMFSSRNGNIEVSVDNKTLNLEGKLKDIGLKTKKGKVLIGLMTAELSIPDFDFTRIEGDVAIPVVSFVPDDEALPVIYSSTGVYVTVKGMSVSVADTGFSFDGGWLEIKDLFLDEEKIEGKFEGSFDGEKVVEVAKLQNTVNAVSGEIGVSGRFKYSFESEKLNYFLSVTSDRLKMRVKYVLAKLTFTDVNIGIEDGKLQYLFAGVSAGGGNIVISGKGKISLSAFNIPVGEAGVWRARVTGNLNYDGKKVKGTVTVSRPVILKLAKDDKETSGIFLPFEADIGINFAEPIVLRSPLWEVKVLPTLKFTVRDSIPVVSGNFFVLGGKIKYMGKEFQIDYGSGVIDNLLDLKGTINIASTSKVNDYYIYMFIRGSLKAPVLYFSSEPPLSREQILSLLMTGATPSDMERSNEIFPVVQVAYYASSFLLKPVEKQFTKILSLESFVVEPYITKYGETVFKLSLTKRIGNRLRLIGYQTTGQDPEFSVGFQYFIGRYKNFYLEYLYSNYYANEYGIGFDVRFNDWEDLKKLRLRK